MYHTITIIQDKKSHLENYKCWSLVLRRLFTVYINQAEGLVVAYNARQITQWMGFLCTTQGSYVVSVMISCQTRTQKVHNNVLSLYMSIPFVICHNRQWHHSIVWCIVQSATSLQHVCFSCSLASDHVIIVAMIIEFHYKMNSMYIHWSMLYSILDLSQPAKHTLNPLRNTFLWIVASAVLLR